MGMFPLAPHVRRAITLGVLVFTVASLWGITQGIFGIGLDTNLMQTGLTPSTVIGILDLIVLFWAAKHRIP